MHTLLTTIYPYPKGQGRIKIKAIVLESRRIMQAEFEVTGFEKRKYEKIDVVFARSNDLRIRLELPRIILQDLGIRELEKGRKILIDLSAKKGDLEKWDIYMRGDVYSIRRKEENGKMFIRTYVSFGGLQLWIDSPEEILEEGPLYMGIKIM